MATTGWLIERTDVRLCYSHGGTCFRWVTFNDPHAWRFDTQVEAERIIREHKLVDVVARGHSWS